MIGEQRVYNALLRTWAHRERQPIWKIPIEARPTLEWLLRWSTDVTDDELITAGNNIGRKTVKRIREMSVSDLGAATRL